MTDNQNTYFRRSRALPFSALVGQEDMKLALILNAIDPGIGGVLLMGEKGAAKSTAVRALADLLPEIHVREGCLFACDPHQKDRLCPYCRQVPDHGQSPKIFSRKIELVELPLNATEDMVLGGLDFKRALVEGARFFSPGLLARAHRGFMYVDEVNLLDDHLVDVIMDSAASGVNRVEREGVSFEHAASFSLVGTMNPEEGELRPGLLDRFGLCVQVRGESDPEARIRLMEVREAYDLDPDGFVQSHARREEEISTAIITARRILPGVKTPLSLKTLIAELSRRNNAAGHRADLAIRRAARALAAYEGRRETTDRDIGRVAPLVLAHRRRDPLPPPPPPEQKTPPEPDRDQPSEEKPEERNAPPEDPGEAYELPSPPMDPSPESDSDSPEDPPETGNRDILEHIFEIGDTFKVRRIEQARDKIIRRGSGRRSLTRTAQKQGRYVKSTLTETNRDLALDATLRAAAPYQLRRRGRADMAVVIQDPDMRYKVREKRIGNFLVFAVDGSGSMGARSRMVVTKGAIMSLLLDAYQKRDRVALVTFRGREAELKLPPTSSVYLAARLLKELPVGGRTPLASGLIAAHEQLTLAVLKDPSVNPLAVIMTDGRTNVPLREGADPLNEVFELAAKISNNDKFRYIVVDTEEPGIVQLNLAGRLAAVLGADYFRIDQLKSQDLVNIARRN